MYRGIDTTNFVREQFKKYLDDGQPHRYRDILEYIRDRAEGTEHEGLVEQNNMVLALKKLVDDPTSGYERIRHGVYQKCEPKLTKVKQTDDVLSKLYGLLDEACALQARMNAVYNQQQKEQPDTAHVNAPTFTATAERLDGVIDCLTAWIADTEDMDKSPAHEEEPAHGFSMQIG